MEPRFHLALQTGGHYGLCNSVRDRGNAENSGTTAMRLRNLHRSHRGRKVAARGHSVPDLEEISLQILLEVLDRAAIHTRRPLICPDLLPCLPYFPLRDLKRLPWRLQLAHPTPPRTHPVDRTNTATDDPAPSLRLHYRDFITTTSRSAGESRTGTRSLAVSAASGHSLSLPMRQDYRDSPSHVPRESSRPGSRRLHAGHRLASRRVSARLVLEPYLHPQFRCHLNTFSTRHQRFACARLPGPHLTPHGRLFHIAHHDGLQPTQHVAV